MSSNLCRMIDRWTEAVRKYVDSGRVLFKALKELQDQGAATFAALAEESGFAGLWNPLADNLEVDAPYREVARFVHERPNQEPRLKKLAEKTLRAFRQMGDTSSCCLQRQHRLSAQCALAVWGEDPRRPSGDSLTMLCRLLAMPTCNAARLLAGQGIALAKLGISLEAHCRREQSFPESLGGSPASRIAQALQQYPIGTEHLLLAFLERSRPSRAGLLLQKLGMSADALKAATLELQREPQDEGARLKVDFDCSSLSSFEVHQRCGRALVDRLLLPQFKDYFAPVIATAEFEAASRDGATSLRKPEYRFIALHGTVEQHLKAHPRKDASLGEELLDLYTSFGWLVQDQACARARSLPCPAEPW